ncbi:hypothetical protein WA026_018953 [Henosepilachna vigintioctopunctata]|uniref:ABC transporter domain-containing protein n=1 Tax=Henosepilachna vigintioctopunctata TaxID=420089 RepID=A0AAW1UMT7_9CUCU
MYNLTHDIIDDMEIKTDLPKKMYLKRFPYPQYEQDNLIEYFSRSYFFSILLMTSFLYACISIVKSITLEKEKQLKESMKIMGLPTWLHWTAWFLQYFIPFLIVGIIITITFTVGNILTYTHWSLVFILLILYILGLITFSFALSVFFSKANRAASLAGIAWVLTMVPYIIIRSSNYSRTGASTKYFTSLFITSGLSYGFDIISLYESRSIGLQWDNIFETSVENNFTFGGILLMMFLDVFIYFIIALYVEQIFPGKFGVPQKWYFIFTKQFWCGTRNFDGSSGRYSLDPEFFEEEPVNALKPGIRIEKLCKNFGPNEVVKDLTVNLYEDQITVLLGHNGAGKTTTMSMLTGLLPPSKGTAIISETAWADAKCSTLSGGMKRKLSVGIALCGNSKVIMLDEPTAGMDPSARRFIWDFLRSQKKGRTILLTTHFMDEADLLGDRVAIMSNGELKCCGSSFFLKKKYGTGYHLIIEQLPNCEPSNVTRVLEEYIPHVKIHTNDGTELTYLLPEDHSSEFPEMLYKLENNMDRLGIRSFGISLTDLEEVFMKVGTNKSDRNLQEFHNEGSEPHTNEFLKIALPLLFIIAVSLAGSYEFSAKIQDARSFTLEDYDQPITLVEKSSTNLEQGYTELLDIYNQKYEITNNITTTMLDLIKKKPIEAKYQYIVGASFGEGDGPIAWVNGEPYHSVPLSLQLLLNSYLEKTAIQMNFVNFPLANEGSKQESEENSLIMSESNLMALSVAGAYIASFYVIFNIKERMSQSKHLQFVSGINVFIFWSISFIVDLVTFLIPVIFIIVSFVILKPKGISTPLEIGVVGVLFSSFSVASLPMMYVSSFLFTEQATGYSALLFLGFISGFPAIMIVMVLESVGFSLVDEVIWLLRFIPNYDFIEAINKMTQCDDQFNDCGESVSREECRTQTCREIPSLLCCSPDDYFSFNGYGILIQVTMMLFVAVIYFFILFFIDLGTFTNLKYKFSRNKNQSQPQPHIDEDVSKEDDYVHSTPLNQLQSQYILVLKDLVKKYKNFTAVNGLNLTVKKYECFGLLGVNGAGKTTTFKMMTGDEMISFGDGWISSYSIRNQMKTVHKFIGYCPQFDALLDNLTARETLVIFSLIRGVPKDECAYTAEKLARDFDFKQHLDKTVKQLSGGNRRKLSTSIALIGDAPVIFLDEPTTGMDPASKRHLWNELTKIRQSGKSIILTSHSMEECEALCTRLAIMVNGNFQCLGSTQHLKSRFAEGFSITLKIRKGENNGVLTQVDTTAIESFMTSKFPHSELREKHQELLNYYIKDQNIKWSKLFAIMEEAKKKLDIEDYSVGQASLEQVFLTFTNLQTLNEEEKKGRCLASNVGRIEMNLYI